MSAKAFFIGVAAVGAAGAAHAAASGCTFEPRIPASRYEVNGAEVYDKETNLTWQRCSVGQQWKEGAGCVGEARELTRADARRTPANWRLPTKEELDSLVSDACLRSVNAEVFPGITLQHASYWSSSETTPGLTWTVNLTSGAEFNALQTSTNAVKLVRTGR
jgi:hypothetical protein